MMFERFVMGILINGDMRLMLFAVNVRAIFVTFN